MADLFSLMAFVFSATTLFLAIQILNKVSRLERQLVKLPELSDAAKQFANDPRQKIAAIKQVRDETGCGLAEAKEAVEAYTRSQQV